MKNTKRLMIAVAAASMLTMLAGCNDEEKHKEAMSAYQKANSSLFFAAYAPAQAYIDETLKKYPEFAGGHFVQAQIFAKQGNLAGAKRELEIAEKLDPALHVKEESRVKWLRKLIEGKP